MKIQAVTVNPDFSENIQYADTSVPIHFCEDYFDKLLDNEINCHWHTDFEFAYMAKGDAEYSFYGNEMQKVLHEGDGVFVNSKTLHAVKGLSSGSVMRCFSTSPLFFSGQPSGTIYLQNIFPLLNRPLCGMFLLNNDVVDHTILDVMREITAVEADRFGKELLYVEKVSRIWRLMLEKVSALGPPVISESQRQQEMRARFMVSFIHAHFAEDITIGDIANSLNISRTECFRCFKKNTGKSPIDYLLSYRLSQAAKYLIESAYSVSEISYLCGFNDPSYFSRRFKEHFGVSPKQYK